MIQKSGNRLVYTYDSEKLWIEPWGENALRIRSTKLSEMPCEDWALSEPAPAIQTEILIDAGKKRAQYATEKFLPRYLEAEKLSSAISMARSCWRNTSALAAMKRIQSAAPLKLKPASSRAIQEETIISRCASNPRIPTRRYSAWGNISSLT